MSTETVWRAIGGRSCVLVSKGTGVWHALRNEPRGYGKRRRLWEQTTECGMIFSLRTPRADRPKSPLAKTTCRSCRTVLEERFVNWHGLENAGMEAYDAQHADDWWKVQAEWHKPDAPIFKRGDRVSNRDYGFGIVIVVSGSAVLVRFDVRPDLPRSVDMARLTKIEPVPLWSIPATLNYSLAGG